MSLSKDELRALYDAADLGGWGLLTDGRFVGEHSEERARAWVRGTTEAYGGPFGIMRSMGWSDRWRQRLNEALAGRRERLERELVLHLLLDVACDAAGERPRPHIIGRSNGAQQARLRYFCLRYFEGSYGAMASAVGTSRSRLHKMAEFTGRTVMPDLLDDLVRIGASAAWLEEGGGEPVTRVFDGAAYASRYERAGDQWRDCPTVDFREARERLERAFATIGMWYEGDAPALIQRVVEGLAERPGDPEAVVESALDGEAYGGKERDKLRGYVLRGLRWAGVVPG